jgi:hypothetical protein
VKKSSAEPVGKIVETILEKVAAAQLRASLRSQTPRLGVCEPQALCYVDGMTFEVSSPVEPTTLTTLTILNEVSEESERRSS